jgi:hypothetical protein
MLWVRLWRTGFLLFHLIFTVQVPDCRKRRLHNANQRMAAGGEQTGFSNLASLSNIVSALVRIFRSGLFGCVCF